MALIDRGRVMADYLENLGRNDSYKAKFEALCKAVDEAPAVDAAPVVRCKCCKNRDTEKCPMIRYDYDIAGDLVITQDHTTDNGFCDLGERDEEDEQYSPVR